MVKRTRRTKAEIGQLMGEIYTILNADHPMTVRQVFYRLVANGIIDKTESEYKNSVVRLLANMRRSRIIPFNWIADSTRWMRKPQTYPSVEEALRQTAVIYRRSLWDHNPHYVEIWLEKEALAGVLYEETEAWDVPLMVTRGYPSLTYLYEAAEVINGYDRATYLYYFGDHDPSGVDITRVVEREIQGFAPDTEIRFHRVAVIPQQIKDWDLPTRPTKQTDSRSKRFSGESVEVDAIPPKILRELVRQAIVRHLDLDEIEKLGIIEMQEREMLENMAEVGFYQSRPIR